MYPTYSARHLRGFVSALTSWHLRRPGTVDGGAIESITAAAAVAAAVVVVTGAVDGVADERSHVNERLTSFGLRAIVGDFVGASFVIVATTS